MTKIFNEFCTLLCRNFKVLRADSLGLWLTVLLPFIIAVFLCFAFSNISKDTEETDNQVLSALLFFDSRKIFEYEQPVDGEMTVELKTYGNKKSEEALQDFKDDWYLYSCLYPLVSNRGEIKRDINDKIAETIWKGTEDESLCDENKTSYQDIPQFSHFRYMLSSEQMQKELKWDARKNVTKEDEELLGKRTTAITELKHAICSEESTRSHMTIFFILIASAIWMGLLPACKEIVAEWNVFLRESRNNMSSSAFLGAKFTMLAIVTAIQNLILLCLTGQLWQKLPTLHFFSLYLVLVLTSICAASFGLLISCFTSNIRQGLMTIPMIMVAQLIFGGLLRLPAQTRDKDMKTRMVREVAEKATIQYWAFESATGFVSRLPEEKILKNKETAKILRREIVSLVKPGENVRVDKEDVKAFLESKTSRVDDYIFGGVEDKDWGKAWLPLSWLEPLNEGKGFCEKEDDWKGFVYHVVRPITYIILAICLLLIITYILLKLKLAITRNGGILSLVFRI